MTNYTRSAKTKTKFTNKGKSKLINEIHAEYIRLLQKIIDIEFNKNDHQFPKFIPTTTEQIIKEDTWLSARMIQAIGKHAMGILRGITTKHNKRKYILDQMNHNDPNYTKLLHKINTTSYSKPTINTDTPMMLDSRMVTIIEDENSFKWIKLSSIGNKIKPIYIPFKETGHMKTLVSNGGKINNSLSLSSKEVQFSYTFEVNEDKMNPNGKVIGVDIGISSCISASNGFQSGKNNHGKDLHDIMKKMAKKKKGSKAFRRNQKERFNYINWSVNQLFKQMEKENISVMKCEDIKNLRYKHNTNRFMSHWSYPAIFDKLKRKSEEMDVLFVQISPTYTSRRCSGCGWTKNGNRNGSNFVCDSCGFTCDADMNAAINISMPLTPIGFKGRLKYDIDNGFYWNISDQASIVPDSKKT